MNHYKLDHLFSYSGTLAQPEAIGPVAEGVRVVFYSTGGEISGPAMRGNVRPVGGDLMTIRRDGVVAAPYSRRRATKTKCRGPLLP